MTDIFDLYTVDAHGDGAEMQVKGPDGVKLDMFITFVGVDSDKWDEIQREYRPKQLEALKDSDTRIINRIRAEMMSKAALGWRGVESKGETIDFTVEKLTELFINAPYIWDQANLFIADRVNFIKG